MTNATDALRALIAELARDVHYAIADDGLAPLSPPDNNAMREAIQRVLTPERIAALATPAGSASGEDDALDYQMAASAEAAEVDRRGKRIAALQAEVARAREMNRALADDLCAAEAEAARLREDALAATYRDAVFDGKAVFDALTDHARARTSAENVADVLDAVAKVASMNQPQVRRLHDAAIQGSANGQG